MNKSKIKVIAIYLPQYYPIPENDQWYGKGFTEWTNVGRARPLFRGHYQPRVPADLGYYDLRITENQLQQTLLAKEAGITAFCYYHYWFGNKKKILDLPLNNLLKTPDINFPFCLAWANHSWYKKTWEANSFSLRNELLIEQLYSGEQDIIDHFYNLLPAFKDKRYYLIHKKLAFAIYDCMNFVDIQLFKSVWDKLAKENDLPGFYYIGCANSLTDLNNSCYQEYDATILSLLQLPRYGINHIFIRKLSYRLLNHISSFLKRPINVYDYSKVINKFSNEIFSNKNIYPTLIPNWDNSPRRGAGAYIIKNSTPTLFKEHSMRVFSLIKNKPNEDRVVFIKSWNEWGEGNYMEPDLRFGKGYIYALKEALEEYENNIECDESV